MSWQARSGLVILRIGQALTDLRLAVTGSSPSPQALRPGPFLTLVARLPPQRVGGVCRQAAAILDPFDCYVYPPETVHLTVLSLGRTKRSSIIPETLLESAAGLPPLRVRVRRVGYSSGSAYLVLEAGASLWRLRTSLAASIGLRPNRLARLRQAVAVANFARFGDPLRRDVAARLRGIALPDGVIELTELELVETDKALSSANTRRLASVNLSSGEPEQRRVSN